MNLYRSYRQYLKQRFGGPVLKVPVNGGFSCPNKENGLPGCAFCDNRTFSPVALRSDSVVQQFVDIRDRSRHRFSFFIPYLQPNTNTYAPVEVLREIYEPLIAQDGVVGLALGTRPDTVDTSVCDYLAEINSRTYLSVELGLQSANDRTLATVSRGHTVKDFVDAVYRLADRSIEVVVHLMVGLPGDDMQDMIVACRLLSTLPISGVKIHQLMIIENTEMVQMYQLKQVSPLSIESYAEILAVMLENLREDILIHRIMADTRAEMGLIAPEWSGKKTESITFLHRFLEEKKCRQGSAITIP